MRKLWFYFINQFCLTKVKFEFLPQKITTIIFYGSHLHLDRNVIENTTITIENITSLMLILIVFCETCAFLYFLPVYAMEINRKLKIAFYLISLNFGWEIYAYCVASCPCSSMWRPVIRRRWEETSSVHSWRLAHTCYHGLLPSCGQHSSG